MLGRAREHDESAKLNEHLFVLNLVRKVVAKGGSIIARETIAVDVASPGLQLLIFHHILIRLVKLVNHLSHKRIYCFPNFKSIVTIVVSGQFLWIVNSTILAVLKDVGPLDTVNGRGAFVQLHLPISSNGKDLVKNTTIVHEGGSAAAVDGHGVVKVRTEELEDGMGVWKVSHYCHTISLQCSVAGEEVSGELMELQHQEHNDNGFRNNRCM